MPFKAYTPFELGEIAHNQKLPLETNPYKAGTWEWHEWRAGYLATKAASRI